MLITPVNVAGSMESGDSSVNQKARHLVDKYFRRIQHVLYPPSCVFCGLPTGVDDICPDCIADLAVNSHACICCALPLQTRSDQLCGQCLQFAPYFDMSFAPFIYTYPLDRLIQKFKFRGDLRCGRILAGLLLKKLQQSPGQLQASALVPVPLARRRLVERGFNQSFELARDLGRGLGLPVMSRHLLRVRDTRAQSELGADLRHANVHNAFTVKKAADLPRRVALIDDVMTTCSTVNECARILKTMGVQSVSVWVVARAP